MGNDHEADRTEPKISGGKSILGWAQADSQNTIVFLNSFTHRKY